jgi:transposase
VLPAQPTLKTAQRGIFQRFYLVKIKVSDVIFRDDLYPRIETSAVTVQKYAEDLEVLPPIIVNQHNELIDGWHRWTAHRKNEVEEIEATVVETASDADLLEKAIETNASHGLQLSQNDKRDMARRIYNGTPEAQRDEKKKHLAKVLSVSERTIRDWLGRIDKDSKEQRKQKIFDLWLAGYSTDEIALTTGASKADVSGVCSQMADLPNLNKPQQSAADHATDFETPIYNVWKQQSKSEGSSHFGNSEVRWVDNLLYLYTKPFDVVVDPFAGGGSTIDICKKRLRRYFVSDRKPIVEREKEIRQHDLKDGPLKPPQWKDVKLVYLDPPYWIQAEGQYSDDADDLGNQSLELFTANLSAIINQYAKKLTDAYIALIIQPTQWKAPERQFVDHIGDMMRAVKLPVDMRYSVPYESQQCNAQMVDWAKDNKRCLVLTREIVVWRVA